MVKKLIVVLGMHRSGTSVITRGLQVMGVELGNNLMPPALGDNDKGYWEDLDIYSLNLEMLEFLKTDWYYLTPIQNSDVNSLAARGYVQRAVELLNKKTASCEIFGFKDPRTAKLLPFWVEVFRQGQFDVSYVISLRHPLSVCQSLTKRNGFETERGAFLWLEHVLGSLTGTVGENRILVDYDKFMETPGTELARVANRLQLQILPVELEKFETEFLDNELRHTVFQVDDLNQDELPRLIRDVYTDLLSVSDLDSPVISEKMKRWTVEFASQKNAFKLVDKATSKAVLLQKTVADRENQIQTATAQLLEKDRQITQLDQVIQQVNWQLDDIKRSRAWRLILFLRQIRLLIIPPGSFQARAVRKLLQLLRQFKSSMVHTNATVASAVKQNRLTSMLGKRYAARVLAKQTKSIQFRRTSTSPTVSIIIAVHNQVEYTLNCLLSIAVLKDPVEYEIIVIDDASTDPTQGLLKKIDHLKYIQNNTNLGFLASCNKAAKRATGEYLVFLNNDTRVRQGWLENLLGTFTSIPNTGLSGSKLIFPNGKMQEAGGVIWADGSAMNFGREDDPENYLYNYVREVDYVSGASIMIPRTLWEVLEGFDPQYQPAYYEDVDLAFRVRQAGYKVIYQPFSQVTHYEGISNGVDVTKGMKRYQVLNHEKFFNLWKHAIKQNGLPNQQPDYLYRERGRKFQVLFIDDGAPRIDRYAGAVLSDAYITALHDDGYAVTFLPIIDFRNAEQYTRRLQEKGVECVYPPYEKSPEHYIQQNGARFDYVVMSRANIASQVIDLVREFAPNAKLIFNTIDLHFMRLERAAQISGKAEDRELALQAKEEELSIIRKIDCTLVVSEVEEKLLAHLAPDANVKVVPFPADLFESQYGFSERHDIVFLGGFMHTPNIDAVLFFVREIWPLVSISLPEARFVIAGADPTREIRQLSTKNVVVRGYVDDLGSLFSTAKVSVAPLRFGAGIKGKILTSLGYGVPCVATDIAAEGMGLTHGKNVLIANTPREYAGAVLELYSSAELWKTLCKEGQDLIRQTYSREAITSRLLTVLKEL